MTTDDGRRTKHDGKSSHGLWPGELKTINKRSTYVRTLSNVGVSICATTSSNVGMSICGTTLPIRDVAQIDIPTLLDLWRSFFDKGEMRRFIVVIYNSEVYTRAYY